MHYAKVFSPKRLAYHLLDGTSDCGSIQNFLALSLNAWILIAFLSLSLVVLYQCCQAPHYWVIFHPFQNLTV